MITSPASRVKTDILDARRFPNQVAEAPRRIKTSENPTIKKIELFRILRFSLLGKAAEPPCALISVNDTPDIKEIYPGTSGRTQGDKKEIRPAANAM